MLVIQQHAKALAPVCNAAGRLHCEFLESRDFVFRGAGHVLKLAAMIDGQRHQGWPLAAAIGRPMDMVEGVVIAQCALGTALAQEVAEFIPAWIFRRAHQPRDGECAARIGPGRCGGERFTSQPAAQQARHERIACAQHVIDFDRETRADDAVFEIVGDGAVINDAAHRAALQHDSSGGERANGAQRSWKIGLTRGDQHFFFGANYQIAIGQYRLVFLRYVIGRDIALEPGIMPGQTPEVGAIIDVEYHLAAMCLGNADRLFLCGLTIGAREVGAGNNNRTRRGNVRLINIVFRQRHVCAIGAIENHRRNALGLHRQQHQRSQALLVGGDP